MRTIRKQALSTVLIYVTVLTMIFSVFGVNSVNAAGQKLDGILDVHTTKVYDGFKNTGGYDRPSASVILNDFKSNIRRKILLSLFNLFINVICYSYRVRI